MNSTKYERKENSDIERIMDDYNSGDSEKRQQAMVDLFESLRWFIVQQIGNNSTYTSEFEDIMSAVKIEIFQAMDKYNPKKGAPTTFFSYSIRHAISNYKNDKNNHSSTHYSNLANKVRTAQKELERKGIKASIPALAVQAEITPKQVQDGLAIINGSDEKTFDANNNYDISAGPITKSTERLFFEQSESELWAKIFEDVDEDELAMFKMYHGIDSNKYSYTEIAKLYGKTVKQVSQTIEKVRRTLYRNHDIRSYYGKRTSFDQSLHIAMMPSRENAELISSQFEEFDDDEDISEDFI